MSKDSVVENEILYSLEKYLKSDPNFTILIFLPNENIELDSLRINWKDNDFNKIHNSLNSENLLFGLPKLHLFLL